MINEYIPGRVIIMYMCVTASKYFALYISIISYLIAFTRCLISVYFRLVFLLFSKGHNYDGSFYIHTYVQ